MNPFPPFSSYQTMEALSRFRSSLLNLQLTLLPQYQLYNHWALLQSQKDSSILPSSSNLPLLPSTFPPPPSSMLLPPSHLIPSPSSIFPSSTILNKSSNIKQEEVGGKSEAEVKGKNQEKRREDRKEEQKEEDLSKERMEKKRREELEDEKEENEEEGKEGQGKIKKMLRFFIKNVGVMRRSQLEAEGAVIHGNEGEYKEIFHGLLRKFLSSTKTKEEKIKYILRKSFKYMKDKLTKDQGLKKDELEKVKGDKIEKVFFKHYFSEKFAKNKRFLTKSEISFMKDLVMPFRKNSQNKTMNMEFLKTLFENRSFLEDYKEFLDNFFQATDEDNRDKINKTTAKIMDLMKTKEYKGFSQKYFKRMPWLDVWRIEAKEVAISLCESFFKDEPEILKKLRKDDGLEL